MALDDDLQKLITCFGASFCIGLILFLLIFIFGSMETLEATEKGLDFDMTRVKIDDAKLYDSGMHFIGLTHTFIRFPTELQAMEFLGTDYISARTKDGLQCDLELSFQYNLQIDVGALLQLYMFFPETEDQDFREAYRRLTRNIVRDTTAKFDAFEFIDDTTLLRNQMADDITEALKEYYAVVANFQLTEIRYPEIFESAIQLSQTNYLQIQEAIEDMARVETEVEGNIRRAETESVVLYNEAQVKSTQIIQGAEGEAAAIQQRILAQIPSFHSLKEDLNLRDQSLVAFQWVNSMKDLNGKGKVLRVMMDTPNKIACMFDVDEINC